MPDTYELPRPKDGEGFCLHFTGGFRASKVATDAWHIDPIISAGRVCAKGPLTADQVQAFCAKSGLQAIAFHSFSWTNGEYHSSWRPIVAGRKNHTESPAELWGNIARNIARDRTRNLLDTPPSLSIDEVARAIDDHDPIEALARHISLSLRNMDVSIEMVAEHYHEQLVNHLSVGQVNGEMRSNTESRSLQAHIHSFFLHLGAARDYLASLIGHRIGYDYTKFGGMAWLVGKLRVSTLPKDQIIALLLSSGYIVSKPDPSDKMIAAGWLEEASLIRKELVHRRPYGSRFHEQSGQVLEIDREAGFYRYSRPYKFQDGQEEDLLNLLRRHYATCNKLMLDAKDASLYPDGAMHITDDDILSS